MGALFNDLAAVDHQDLGRIADGRQPATRAKMNIQNPALRMASGSSAIMPWLINRCVKVATPMMDRAEIDTSTYEITSRPRYFLKTKSVRRNELRIYDPPLWALPRT